MGFNIVRGRVQATAVLGALLSLVVACGPAEVSQLSDSTSSALASGDINTWSCNRPAQDYSRVGYRGVTLNRYTIELLNRAEAIAASRGLPTPFRLTQGSYSTSVSASAGTHAGGGALDMSINGSDPAQYHGLVKALRDAGFAAWHRHPPAFPYHIHAIALGDTDASSDAKSQITQYLRGDNGLANWGPDEDLPYAGRTPPAWANVPGGQACRSAVRQFAFQANTGSLWTLGTEGMKDWGLGMAPGTSPSITALTGGGFEAAFQANTTSLWTVGNGGWRDWSLGMMPGTSPSIAGLAGGGYVVAFQANTGHLWTAGTVGVKDWGLGMMQGTSPSVTGLTGGGYEIAFQANTSSLWTVGDGGWKEWALGMAAGTSPSITGLTGGGFEVAFQANTSSLWTVGDAEWKEWGLGMAAGTSPSITALADNNYEVAFQANTSSLWTVGGGGWKAWGLGMMAGTSPTIQHTDGLGYTVAFEANTTELWEAYSSGGAGGTGLGMQKGTSPGGT